MRINITGNAASGKTTLAAQLGAELDLPVFSLDSIVWQPHWIKTPPEQRLRAEQRELRWHDESAPNARFDTLQRDQ